MAKKVVSTKGAPAAVGPYSQAIVAGGFVFCSGQIPLDPDSGELLEGSIADQTRRCLDSLGEVLGAAGAGLDSIVKTTVYLTDIADYPEFNEAYAAYFASDPPARAAVAVAGLPKGAQVEVECVAEAPH